MNRLALGTAQFGLDYGITNTVGRPSDNEVRAMLDVAAQGGLDLLDTAMAYGDSETRLGHAGTATWHVVTKLPGVPEGEADVRAWVWSQVEAALGRLRRRSLYGLLLHRPTDLLTPRGEALAGALSDLQEQGLVGRLGVSIYDPAELSRLLTRLNVGLVQAPFSIVDRRLKTSGWLDTLQQSGVEVHVRSVFLQGVLLQPSGARPAAFDRWGSLWQVWERWLMETGLTPSEACLRFVMSHAGIRYAVIGADSAAQLNTTIASVDGPLPPVPDALAMDDPALVNPSQWSRT